MPRTTPGSSRSTAPSSRGARAKRTREGFSFKHVNRQALPLTIRLPGALRPRLALSSVKIDVEPAGAALTLGLQPGGSVLIASAPMRLAVTRGARTVVAHRSTLGQLFPGASLTYRIPWNGSPTAGAYRVRGVIRPAGAEAIRIDRTLDFTPAAEDRLRETAATPVAAAPQEGVPTWVWAALAAAGVLLVGLATAVWRLARRPRRLAPRVA